jgi:hypothetical protein
VARWGEIRRERSRQETLAEAESRTRTVKPPTLAAAPRTRAETAAKGLKAMRPGPAGYDLPLPLSHRSGSEMQPS